MDLLIHICCGPCATYPVQRLREQGFNATGYWYNPNIHPWLEHEKRRESLAYYASLVDLPLLQHPGYDVVEFFRRVNGKEQQGDRCAVCYEMRLESTAAKAAQLGFPCITTTLLISPYQDQDLIRAIGEEAAERHGLSFYFENFRRGWNERSRLTRELELYRQQYCGCLYSEYERYTKESIETAADVRHEDR